MVKQVQKLWSRDRALTLLKAVRRELTALEKMAQGNKKVATSELLAALSRIDKPRSELEAMMDPQIKMPQALKKTLASTIAHIKKMEDRLRGWTITEGERLQKIIDKGGK